MKQMSAVHNFLDSSSISKPTMQCVTLNSLALKMVDAGQALAMCATSSPHVLSPILPLKLNIDTKPQRHMTYM